MSLNCQHSEICAACPWMPMDYAKQSQNKIKALRESLGGILSSALPPIQFTSVGASSLRDRADLVIFEAGFGLYAKAHFESPKKLFPVEDCPQLSAKLFSFYQDLKKEKIGLKNPTNSKGSIRLRVSPQGHRGLWLDFSNQDVQYLFEEKKTLHRLLSLSALEIIEVGQKRKKLFWDNERFRLKDPVFYPWTRTWVGEKSLPLYSVVGGFSQSSDHANQFIIKDISELLTQTTAKTWLEFGCGNGNLTFPLAQNSEQVIALEYEGLAVAGLEKTLDEHPEWKKKIVLCKGDFQKSSLELFSQFKAQGILANPPRSGLKDFLLPLDELAPEARPKDFVYMSCFLESFARDSLKLSQLGYELKDLRIIDQFPQSEHFEILSRWVNTEQRQSD